MDTIESLKTQIAALEAEKNEAMQALNDITNYAAAPDTMGCEDPSDDFRAAWAKGIAVLEAGRARLAAQPAPQGASEGWFEQVAYDLWCTHCVAIAKSYEHNWSGEREVSVKKHFMEHAVGLMKKYARFAPTATGVSEDTKRLDWLEANCGRAITRDGKTYVLWDDTLFPRSCREAIDRAKKLAPPAQSSQGSKGGQS